MRIDLEHSPRRPWPLRVGLWVIRRLVGMVPGPLLVMSYRPGFMSPALRGYLMRPMRSSRTWSRGEAELMGAFVSDLNRCHF